MKSTRSSAKYCVLSSVLAIVVISSLILGPWLRPVPRQATSSEPEVRMSYSWRYTDTVGGTVRPSIGRTFLVVSLTIQNRGYSNFTADPFSHMFVVVGDSSYNVSSAYYIEYY